jgi:hypothetical protein
MIHESKKSNLEYKEVEGRINVRLNLGQLGVKMGSRGTGP